MMRKRNKYAVLISNTALFSIGTFASKLLTFFMVRFYTGVLTPTEYGTADLIMQTANLLTPIISLGMVDGVFRFALDRTQNKKKVFSSGATVIFIGSLFLLLISLILSYFGALPEAMWLIVPFSFFSAVHSLCAQFIRAEGKTALFAFQGIINTALVIALNILFLAVFHFGINGYILSVVLADALCTLMLIFLERLWEKLTLRLDKALLKQMLQYSVPLIPTTVFWWITSVSDRYMVTYFLGSEANGLYAVAYKIPTLVSLISGVFLEAWQFSAVREASNGRREHIYFYSVVWNLFQAAMMFVGSIIIAFSKPFISLLADEEYYEAWKFVPVLTIAMVLASFTSFMGSVYMVHKKSRLSLWTAMAGAVINILLNLILIPRIGTQGAALATLASYFASMLLRMSSAKRILPFKLHRKRLAAGILVLAVQTAVLILPTAFAPVSAFCPIIIAVLYRKPLIIAARKLLRSGNSKEKK